MAKRKAKQAVTLREKKLNKGNISLYLDIYKGTYTTPEGKQKLIREYEFLKLYIKEKPKGFLEKEDNRITLSLAEDIRMKRESEIKHSEHGFISPHKKKINFIDYFDNYINSYKKADIRMLNGALNNFKEFINTSYIRPLEITETLIESFRDFLLNKYNGQSPHSYFARFKKVIKQATKENIYLSNPAENVICPNQEEINKGILNIEEIINLSNTECGNSEVKKAFLFCLNTGLRYVDVKDLNYKHIQNNLIVKRQTKTLKNTYIDLNENAINLIGDHKEANELIFNLPSQSRCYRILKNWTKDAGITQNITWHSARHSFATILMMNKTDLKTVSSLLGHARLDHTQKYIHLVNELKKEAVNTLPQINTK